MTRTTISSTTVTATANRIPERRRSGGPERADERVDEVGDVRRLRRQIAERGGARADGVGEIGEQGRLHERGRLGSRVAASAFSSTIAEAAPTSVVP